MSSDTLKFGGGRGNRIPLDTKLARLRRNPLLPPILVEYPGIEPGVPKGGGFTVHCITIDASTPDICTHSATDISLPFGSECVY